MNRKDGVPKIYPEKIFNPIITTQLCCYGCGRTGKYESVRTKKICCESHQNKCPAKIKRIKQTKTTIIPGFGKTPNQIGNEKSLKTRIDAGTTKTSQIKGGITRVKNGHYTRLANIMQEKWNNEPWANRFRVNFKEYKDTKIAYQGTYEFNFIEQLESLKGLDWVKTSLKRGIPFWYINKENKRKLYLPDFIIGNTLYEIKSRYTWNRDIENNKRKLDEAVKQGYNVILVLNKKEYEYPKSINEHMD